MKNDRKSVEVKAHKQEQVDEEEKKEQTQMIVFSSEARTARSSTSAVYWVVTHFEPQRQQSCRECEKLRGENISLLVV